MQKWLVTFTKKLEYEFSAETEAEALVEAMKINLDQMPIEWEMIGPTSLSQIIAETPLPVPVPQAPELDSFGRPLYDLDGEQDEQDDYLR